MNETSNSNFDQIWKDWQNIDCLSAKIDEHVEDRASFYKNIGAIMAPWQPGRHILEIGCGTAIDSYWLNGNYPQHHYAAIDLSHDSIKIARKIGNLMKRQVSLFVGDLYGLPFKSSSFDLVFSQGVLEHFPDLISASQEQVRVLKKGGYLVLSVPQKYNPYTLYKRKQMRMNSWPYGWETEYSWLEMKAFGEQLGLEVVSMHGHGYGYYEDYAFSLLPRLARRMQRQQKSILLKNSGDKISRILRPLEERFGYLFMLNIVAIYRK